MICLQFSQVQYLEPYAFFSSARFDLRGMENPMLMGMIGTPPHSGLRSSERRCHRRNLRQEGQSVAAEYLENMQTAIKS